MARGVIPIHPLTRLSSTAITVYDTADSTDDHEFSNRGTVKQALLIRNNSLSSFTATIPTPYTIDGLALPDLTVTVAAGDTAIVGPMFPGGVYNQTGNVVHVDAGATDADVLLTMISF